MYIRSSFPDQAKVTDCNAYEALWNRYDQAGWSDDLILHIEGISGRKRTYQEFRTLSIVTATALGSPVPDGLGFREKGEMIVIISHNSLDYAVLVHSLLLLATPFALLNPCWTPFEFEYALKLTKVTRLFVQDELLPTVLQAAKNIIEMNNIYVLGHENEGFKTFEEIVEDARSRAIAPVSPRAVTKDTLAYLMFSSGTTGHPKAVMISHGNIISNFNKSVHRSGLGLDGIGKAQQHEMPVHFIWVTMCFSSGLTSYCFYPFLSPATFVIISDPSVEVALEAMARYRVTIARFEPSFIRRLLHSPHIKDADLSSLRLVLSSSSYFSSELLAKLAVVIPHEFYFGQTYGMTESSSITVLKAQPIISGKTDYRFVDSVGMLFPGVEAHVVREDGSEADVNEVGELYVRSECVALGYWNDEKATREGFVDGWLRTGDSVRVDQDGCFSIVGRIKDIFKTPEGRQISPFQVEDVLLSEPQGLIADAVVAGVSVLPTLKAEDELKGEIPRGWIVLSDEGKKLGADTVIKELEFWYQPRLGNHKWLHGGVEIVDKIPKSTSGKPLRALLRKKFEEHVSN